MSDIETNKIEFKTTKTARVLLKGSPVKAGHVWVCLHGYGQQIQGFSDALLALKTAENALIIPEALNRFYTKGSSGEVGASWMTREERNADIKDNISYLDDLCSSLCGAETKISVLGFSQGAATAVRWSCRGNTNIENIVLWAGALPADLEIESDIPQLKKLKITLVVGDADEYLDSIEVGKMCDYLQNQLIPFDLIRFDGGHSLKSAVLKQLSAK